MSSAASLPPLLSRCAFDHSTPAPSSYLQVCGDDSVKLWSVAGACVIKHFLLPPKSAAAVTAHAISSVESKGKKKGQQQRTLIAVGTATGSVVLFDATLGECQWSVRDSSASGAVTACAIDASRARIFSAATDCSLVARSLDDGSPQMTFKVGKHHAACIAISPDGTQLVAAGAFIKLFSVASQAQLCRYSSSASAVTHASFSPCGAVFATCGTQRSVSIWSTSPSQSSAPLRILTLDAAPLACCFSAYSSSTVDVAAVSSSGAAFVWRVQQPASALLPSDAPLQPMLHLKQPAGDGQQVHGLRFVSASSLALARGGSLLTLFASVLPHFEVKDVAAGGGGGAAPAIVELSKLSKAALLPPPPAASAATAPASAISVADASAMLVPPSSSASVAESKRSKTAAALAADADGDAIDAAGDLDGAEVEGEESLGDRTRRMGGGAASAPSRLEAPKADSVAVLLQQGLQAGDDAMVEQCLDVKDVKVITATVQRMPPHLIPSLLTLCIARIQARPSRAVQLSGWIRCILVAHAALLVSMPDVAKLLQPMYQMIEARVAVHPKLLRLSGRLDLAMSQVSLRGKSSTPNIQEPLVVYKDDAGDAHDAMASGSSSSSDDDDDDDDDGSDGMSQGEDSGEDGVEDGSDGSDDEEDDEEDDE